MQAGVGPGADILGPGNPDLEAVCSGVEMLLRHGLRPATPREGWTHYLPGRRTGPLDMLLVGSLPMFPSASSSHIGEKSCRDRLGCW